MVVVWAEARALRPRMAKVESIVVVVVTVLVEGDSTGRGR